MMVSREEKNKKSHTERDDMPASYEKPAIIHREAIEARAGSCDKALPGCNSCVGGAAVS
jgi:hypothetical protein